MKIKKGESQIVLHDLTGFNGRCDKILFTTNPDLLPPNDVEKLSLFKKKLLKLPVQPEHAGKFDLMVAGGGLAGICTALAAARLGLKVALIQDRPILGGNNSSEVRVGLGGRINLDPYPALGNLVNEIGPSSGGNARPASYYEDQKKLDTVLSEKNISLFLNYRVTAVEKKEELITAVIATGIENSKELRFESHLFADCTGDATLGFLSGADFKMGREAKNEFDEPSAPELSDEMTMGASVQWYCDEMQEPSGFSDIRWGLAIDEKTVQKVKRGQWYWEVGMRNDQIKDFERIRDYGMYVAFSNWSYLKNRYSGKKEYTNSQLKWMAYIAGKRESRRLMGDYILREQDLKNRIIYPDGTVSTSWYVDLHYPDPEITKYFPGQEFLSIGKLDPIQPYPIPYRCFYSRTVKNLFMAGRNISVTHIALGTVRVMRTTGMMGEVVGLAASVCRKHDVLPEDVYLKYFDELKILMKRGAGKSDLPKFQTYNLIDLMGERHEDS
ncbi:MAG: FAD-dependent oxidoreductase [Mangrovibacterium sp.]